MDNINENNLQFLEEEVSTLINDNEEEEKELIEAPKNVRPSDKDDCIMVLKSRITQLSALLSQKNRELSETNKKNNSLKISILKSTEETFAKEHTINELNKQLSKFKADNEILKEEQKELEKQIKELSYSNIELNQKLNSSQSMMQLNEKLYSIKTSKTESDSESKMIKELKIELMKANHELEESKIENFKIAFENKVLKNSIDGLKTEKESNEQLENNLHKKEIEGYKNFIANFQSQLEEAINSTATLSINEDFLLGSEEILSQFNQLDGRIKELELENDNLRSSNTKYKNENGHNVLKIKSKDQIIEKLQEDKEKTENAFKMKVLNLENMLREGKSENNKNLLVIDELMKEKEMLQNANIELQETFNQMKDKALANDENFSVKKGEYQNEVSKLLEKQKEYKRRIRQLKLKVNELYEEIDILKGKDKGAYSSRCVPGAAQMKEAKEGQMPLFTLTPGAQQQINSNMKDTNLDNQAESNLNTENNVECGTDPERQSVLLKYQEENKEQLKALEAFKETLTKVDQNLLKYNQPSSKENNNNE